MELLNNDIYNTWIDKSLEKLAKLLPARYAKPEEASEFVESILEDKSKSISNNNLLEQTMIQDATRSN